MHGNMGKPIHLCVFAIQAIINCTSPYIKSPASTSTGVPSCAVVDISTAPDSSLTVSMRAGDQPWLLSVWFQVVVASANRLTRSFSTTANKTTISPCQAEAMHNISVYPCNEVGCNKACPTYPINKTTSEGTAPCTLHP